MIKENKISFKERLIYSLSFASNFFDSFYKAGFIILIILNTVTSIVFFTYLGGLYYDTNLFLVSAGAVKFLSYILLFWICSLAFSLIFSYIRDILVKRQEIKIINKLKEEENDKFKRKTK